MVKIGDKMIVFNAHEWQLSGYDQPDGNAQFFQLAEILEIGPERAANGERFRDQIATVRFPSGLVSRGHFVEMMSYPKEDR
jgi:hypothetical protein